MSTTLDTNVLVHGSNQDSGRFDQAQRLLAHLSGGPAIVVLLWPTILGYLRIATHPSIFPSPLTQDQAVGNVTSLLARPHVRVGGEEQGFWDVYGRVTGDVPARGNLVLDAHLVALMHQHGVSTIWSGDRDLRKFSGIEVNDPFHERYADGFA